MNELDEIYSKIQALLMKKDSECGQLKLLSSRITEENAKHIDNICQELQNILTSSKITNIINISSTNENCIKLFEYLIFNTCFDCQEQLAEDIVKGHLVDICPPLSPFLLLSILYHLQYDNILSESIRYFPLELSTEIISNLVRYISILKQHRARTIINDLITNSYRKLVFMKDNKVHSLNSATSLDNFATSVFELIVLIKEKKLISLPDDDCRKKASENFGYIIKDLLKLTQNCLAAEKGCIPDKEAEKVYKVTFGRNSATKLPSNEVQNQVALINAELLNVLTLHLQEVDVNFYLDWAEYDTPDSATSLQQSIGIDCYNCMNALSKAENCSEMLMNCLKQLSCKPQEALDATLEDLCKGLDEAKRDCLKQLMGQTDQWNPTVFEYIQKNALMLDKNDISTILQYLTTIINNSAIETHIQDVYNTVSKAFMSLNIGDAYDVAIGFILSHNAENILESAYTEDMFNSFISRNANLKNVANLKFTLFYIMKNPEKFLGILVKMCIGHPDYKNVMIPPEDLFLLNSVMKIRRDQNGTKLILHILKESGLEAIEFEFKKYSKLISAMIAENVFSADEVTNVVFIPMLEGNLPASSVKSALHCITKYFSEFSETLEIGNLLKALAQRITNQRKNVKFPKYINDELLMMATKVVRSLLHHHADWIAKPEHEATIGKICTMIYPIDQMYFRQLLNYTESPNIIDIMSDYLRRIRGALLLANDLKEPLIDPEILSQYFRLHLILNCTDKEYIKIASELTVIHWDYFGSADENEALIQFIGLTIKVLRVCLELPNLAPQSFPCFIKCFASFMKDILRLQSKWDYEKIAENCRNNFQILSGSIEDTGYENYYEELMVFMNNTPIRKISLEFFLKVIAYIDNFGSKCLQAEEIKSPRVSDEITRHLICQEIIGLCLNYEIEHASVIVRTINKLKSIN